MADEAGRRSLTWLWALAALVVIAGFLVWLGVASEPSQVAVVEEEGEATEQQAEAAMGGGATVVPRDTLAANKARFAGQNVEVQRVEATGRLGPRIFWGELGTPSRQVPILVRMDSAAAAATDSVPTGTFYNIAGVVQAMTDSLATAWGEAGEFAGEGEQMQATFADFYIQASAVRRSRVQQREAPQGDAATAPPAQQPQQPAGG